MLARSSVATEIEQSRIRSPHVVLRLKIARRSVRLQFDKNEKSRENDASVTSSLVCTFSREFSASVAFIVAGARVPLTRRRAVAAAGAVLRRLRGGYGGARRSKHPG